MISTYATTIATAGTVSSWTFRVASIAPANVATKTEYRRRHLVDGLVGRHAAGPQHASVGYSTRARSMKTTANDQADRRRRRRAPCRRHGRSGALTSRTR